jgi:hypothetical protein
MVSELLALLLDDFFQSVKSALQLSAIPGPQTRHLSFFVLAFVIVASTPSTDGLLAVFGIVSGLSVAGRSVPLTALDFSLLTCFATIALWH